MPLTAHLRELRKRLVISAAAIAVAMAVALVFYQPLLQLFVGPFTVTVERLAEQQNIDATINFDGIADPFTVPLRLSILVGVVAASPVWIYQLWAFIVPGLYRHERRWSLLVLGTAVPLFVAGVVLCYVLLPKGLGVLLGFTPEGVANIVSFTRYFSFVVRLMLVFGLAFLLPVFVVLLNAVGIFSGATLSSSRRWIVVGVFAFAAVATPTGDPITMLMLAVPMWLLFEAAVVVCRINDRRRARASGEPDYDELGDDEASVVAPARDLSDDTPSALDEPTPDGPDPRAD
jgi:sec-independent protein translocase protein TatC